MLHYNAGLIYAQVGDFANAYKHFLRAYHLDMTDVQAGAFAMVTGKLVYKDISTLNVNLGQSIADSKMPREQLILFSKIKEWVNNPTDMGVYIPEANEKRAIRHLPSINQCDTHERYKKYCRWF